ncbi:hypothetical protein C8J57DRAFT_1526674 [Mycena rebaudengoi]|nr:hypothetical protein C8J57DRAFT_1526674 [Mycena rebaudengoi]
MPALRTRDTPAAARSLEVTVPSAPLSPPTLTIISPTPRTFAFTFPIAHNLADSPYSSPSSSPFEPDLHQLALGSGGEGSQPPSPTTSIESAGTFARLQQLQRQCSLEQQQQEEDVKPTPLPLSAFTRTLSPLALPLLNPASSTSQTSPRGRKTAASPTSPAEAERRPKKGDDDYVKRPENAFILFRRRCCELRAAAATAAPSTSSASSSAPPSLASGPSSADSSFLAGNASTAPSSVAADDSADAVPGKKQRQADLSKTISAQWKALAPAERAKWEALAKERKREHEREHPGYVYRPQRSAKRAATLSGPSESPRVEGAGQSRRKQSAPARAGCSFGAHARSSSAPTPPPYQAIQVPNVYLDAQSQDAYPQYQENSSMLAPPHGGLLGPPPISPPGPSLIPMISSARRSAYPGPTQAAQGFDYMPSFGAGSGAFDFEASLQSSDFLRAMFPPAASDPASPASSAPGSPYTPASASFHPSAFAHPHSSMATSDAFDAQQQQQQHAFDSASAVDFNAHDFALEPAHGLDAMGLGPDQYASFAAAWAAQSAWGGYAGGLAGMGEPRGISAGDFDVARIEGAGLGAEGWGVSEGKHAEFGGEVKGWEHAAEFEFSGGEGEQDASGYEGMEFGGGYEMDMEMDMGFDAIMGGSGF